MYLGHVTDELAQAGLGLASDNSCVPTRVLSSVLESLHSPRVGAAVDTANPLGIGEGWQISTRVLGHRTLSLHIKDFVAKPAPHGMGLCITGCPVGKGQINVPWIVESFAALRVEPSVILESWTPAQKSLEETIAMENAWAQEGIRYLRRFIAE
jgi:3-oxoisoapionate decarboxylase